jgi:hypothetical protein
MGSPLRAASNAVRGLPTVGPSSAIHPYDFKSVSYIKLNDLYEIHAKLYIYIYIYTHIYIYIYIYKM